jgi:hypothetical protein
MNNECCVTCNEPATAYCTYPLRGAKLGSNCNRPLCRKHLAKRDGKILCLSHFNYRTPVAVKEKDAIIPFRFVIPVERQLSAGEIISVELPAQKPVVNRLELVRDMRELVCGLLDEEPKWGKPKREFMHAMILISPLFMPLDAQTISKAIKYSFLSTRQAIERMAEYKICYVEDEQVRFTGDWLALFADGWQEILSSKEEVFKLSISFILDMWVAAGDLTRTTDEDGEFIYRKIDTSVMPARTRADRIQAGLCMDCGLTRSGNGTTTRCRPCADKANQYGKVSPSL